MVLIYYSLIPAEMFLRLRETIIEALVYFKNPRS